jgi:hypothetical protein
VEKDTFNDFFKGFHFVGCAVRSKNMIYLLGRALDDSALDHGWESDIKKRVINIFLDKPESDRYGGSELNHFRTSHIAVAQHPSPHSVTVDGGGQVYARAKGYTGFEKDIGYDEEKGPQRGGVLNVQAIDGVVYGVGWRRSACKREGPNQWVSLWNKLPVPKVKRKVDETDYGFEAIDGFSSDDIYAAGGEGDIWHYDGKAWKQIPFPSNMRIYNVCCGGDGFVYIAGHGGEVFRGRGNTWSKLCDGMTSYWFKNMVWYQDKVWATNDYGIYAFNEKGVHKLDLPDFVRASMGYMAQGDGVLVIAGMYGASMYDGNEWKSLVDLVDLYKKYGR